MKYILPTILLSAAAYFTSGLSTEPAPALQVRSAETCGDPAFALPLYRIFQPAVPARAYELDVTVVTAEIAQAGWTLERISAMAFPSQQESTVRFYHLGNGAGQSNFWTINTTELNAALQEGYSIVASDITYIYPTQICGSVPFYRASGSANKDNVYTTSESEYLQFIAEGFVDMGIAGYVLPLNVVQCD
ncbi:hypothetical protein MSAN_01372400 [Mycena sanguinolenta]|uniref:DUF5648 domain-containing protein n=1 Tax=Mycena sanguinolenta TaxID=230812 RepID=A0A8H6YA17_9AGAR|nr:hypothetical protein MSAN_01372400 [Mycena sanguinolenta]